MIETVGDIKNAGGIQPGVINVAIIEDKPEIRECLCALIRGSRGFSCSAVFGSMEDALAGIGTDLPDVVLVDIGLPGMSGIDGIRILKERHPGVSLIILTVYDDDERIFEALCAGASGYLLKKTEPTRLLECLREAAEGGAPMSPEVAQRVIRLFRQVRPPAREEYNLTPHETRLLKMMSDGHNTATAAEKLDVTINTIHYHMKHIYEKLHVHSRSDAVAKAIRCGLVK